MCNRGWTLNNVDAIEWKQDASGLYSVVNYNVDTMTVRLDLLTIDGNEPIQSFQGDACNVRKAAMQWLTEQSGFGISIEHAAYMGKELAYAEFMTIDYVQD